MKMQSFVNWCEVEIVWKMVEKITENITISKSKRFLFILYALILILISQKVWKP